MFYIGFACGRVDVNKCWKTANCIIHLVSKVKHFNTSHRRNEEPKINANQYDNKCFQILISFCVVKELVFRSFVGFSKL